MDVKDIKKVACIGGGIIGSSWAIQFAMNGLEVYLRDINEEQLQKSNRQMINHLESLLRLNAISEQQFREIIKKIHLTTNMEEALTGAQFVQENGPERLNIKQGILAEAEQYLAPDAIYASSTSGLLISDICEKAEHPERCIGAHPYNPPHLIPLVELTKSPQCTDEIMQTAKDFYISIKKEPVVLKKECKGFISNRLQQAIYREMVDLVQRGVCTLEDVDKALLYGPGIRWAAFGHNVILQLGSSSGIQGMFELLGDTINDWMDDMANWKTMNPILWGKFAQQEVEKEIANFPAHIGNTTEECRAFRDKVLVEVLKLHGKL